MPQKKITAIIRESMLTDTMKALQDNHIPGVSISYIKGYGEYKNMYSRDNLHSNVKLDIITEEKDAHAIAEIIMETTSTGAIGDGIITITALEGLYRIRDKQLLV